MKVIVEINDAGNDMVTFSFKAEGNPESMAVLRASARMARALAIEHEHIAEESNYIKRSLEESEDE